jgi:hypothetical protein
VNQTKREVRVVGYRVDSKDYWVATDRYDLTAEDIALATALGYREFLWMVETTS